MPDLAALRLRLLEFGETIDRTNFFPTVKAGASEFALSDPFAFLIACCLDRQADSKIIWTIPFDLHEQLGHLDSARIAQMSLDQLDQSVRALPRKPRYVNAAPRTLKELATLVERECDGDASQLWANKSASYIKQLLQGIHGVGPQIANMTPLLIEKAFLVKFSDLERRTMDIKADVHTKRVLYRIGVANTKSDDAAIAAARQVNPVFPGGLDAPLWKIGRSWCSSSSPRCSECVVSALCERVGL